MREERPERRRRQALANAPLSSEQGAAANAAIAKSTGAKIQPTASP